MFTTVRAVGIAALGKIAKRRAWPHDMFSVPLRDLGENAPAFAGIWAPQSDGALSQVGITDQFLANAADYHAIYEATARFRNIFSTAFGAERPANARVLDLGAGSGVNSVIPCLELLRGCTIVATDLSPNLLAILREYLVRTGLTDRVACVCADATQNWFEPESFHIVVGSAVLHHLRDPAAALAAAFSALRPGGRATFFEPFEGWAIAGFAFRSILDRANRGDSFPVPLREFLERMCVDFEARIGTDKSADRFRHMDDKWLFTRTYFAEAATRIGFRIEKVVPDLFTPPATHYQQHVELLLRVAGVKEPFPDWAWQTICRLDETLSCEMKIDCPVEATIVLRKPL